MEPHGLTGKGMIAQLGIDVVTWAANALVSLATLWPW
jgi:hypothetical protein